MRRKRKYSKPVELTEDQRIFLKKVLSENFELSDRETYVAVKVLAEGTYHANYQYHLNKIRDRWTKYWADKIK